MKVFVTGHRGYIAAHAVELLQEHGHSVTGCDIGLFDGCEWEPCPPADRELIKDIRTVNADDLDGHDCMMHLAAVAEPGDDGFAPAFLRNATAFGFPPMLRIDLVVNNLLGSALSYGEIRIKSDGSPWRPLIHCRDIARAFIAFMPAAKITFTGAVGADPRNYRVNGDLLNSLLPDFELQYSLSTGVDELHRKTVDHGFSAADFEGDQFVPPRTLNKRMDLLRKAAADTASSPCLDASGGGHQ